VRNPIVFPYQVYRNFPCPIIRLALSNGRDWFETEPYVDSGASISLFSPLEAERMGLNYAKGRKIASIVGDGSSIPVFLHRLPVRIGTVSLSVTIGFSPRLGVGFNLLGRKDFFRRFDVLFSDSKKTITFLPVR